VAVKKLINLNLNNIKKLTTRVFMRRSKLSSDFAPVTAIYGTVSKLGAERQR
jgi:hypothetical protein